jgi:hypothetical protein
MSESPSARKNPHHQRHEHYGKNLPLINAPPYAAHQESRSTLTIPYSKAVRKRKTNTDTTQCTGGARAIMEDTESRKPR